MPREPLSSGAKDSFTGHDPSCYVAKSGGWGDCTCSKSSGAITPEELTERGWDGASRCRCLAEGEGYVPCPPQMCDAEALLEECRDLSRLHRIAVGLLTDEQLSDYRRARDSNE